MESSLDQPDNPKPPSTRRRNIALIISAVLCIFLAAFYSWQPDWLVPVTLVPAWCWLAPALVFTGLGLNRKSKLWSLAVIAIWICFTGIYVEEARSLLRIKNKPSAEWVTARNRGDGIRVVSLNCAAANWKAAFEVTKWKPDIVLLQESPSRKILSQLSQTLFGNEGSFLWGGDTSIIVRGKLHPRRIDASSHFVHATAELANGLTTDVISVRLDAPIFRLDFFMPGFWIDHRAKRLKHRQQLLEIIEPFKDSRASLILGGDLNTVPRDSALDPLRKKLRDTFHVAGHGWGNTGTNDYPLFRVDQIWASQHFQAESTTAQKTTHSDHRMVVGDLVSARQLDQ